MKRLHPLLLLDRTLPDSAITWREERTIARVIAPRRGWRGWVNRRWEELVFFAALGAMVSVVWVLVKFVKNLYQSHRVPSRHLNAYVAKHGFYSDDIVFL